MRIVVVGTGGVGGFFGGPIVRNKLHYFGSYEFLRNETTNVVTSPLVPVDEREFPEDGTRDQYFFRSEWTINDRHRLGGRSAGRSRQAQDAEADPQGSRPGVLKITAPLQAKAVLSVTHWKYKADVLG